MFVRMAPAQHVTCLLCHARVGGCSRAQLDRLAGHLQRDHRVYFSSELILKLHLLGQHQLEAVRDIPAPEQPGGPRLERLLAEEAGGVDAFVMLEPGEERLALPCNPYDGVEGSDIFFKEKEAGLHYLDMETEHTDTIRDFIKSLPKNIRLDTKFERSAENISEPLTTTDSMKKQVKPNQVECKVCQKKLAKGSMKNHMKLLHSGKKLDCDQCSYESSTKMDLWIHKQKIHNSKKGKMGSKMSDKYDDSKRERLEIKRSDRSSDGSDESSMDSMFEESLNATLTSLDQTLNSLEEKC